jgi:hypothetical protein
MINLLTKLDADEFDEVQIKILKSIFNNKLFVNFKFIRNADFNNMVALIEVSFIEKDGNSLNISYHYDYSKKDCKITIDFSYLGKVENNIDFIKNLRYNVFNMLNRVFDPDKKLYMTLAF